MQRVSLLVLNLNSGTWRTTYQGHSLVWDIGDGTKATIKFRYTDGALREGSLVFNHAVHVWLPEASSISGTLTYVKYDNDGDVVDWDLKQDHKNPNELREVLYLKQHLELSRTPSPVFLGTPVRGMMSSVERCQYASPTRMGRLVNCTTALMLERVRVYSDNEFKGLFVSFKKGSTLQIQDTPYTTGFEFDTSSSVTFNNIDYDPSASVIVGDLVNLTATLQSGRIASRDVLLRVNPTSKIVLNDVKFRRDAAGHSRIQGDGVAHVTLGNGSEIVGGDSSTDLTLDSATAELHGLSLDYGDHGVAKVALHAGTSIGATFTTSKLAFAGGAISISRGNATIEIQNAEWQSNQKRIAFAGTLRDARLVLIGGSISPNKGSNINLIGGEVNASHLNIDSNSSPMVQGIIEYAQFELAPDQRFIFPGSFTLQTGATFELLANSTLAPLQLVNNDPFPIGRFLFKGDVREFRNVDMGTFVVRDAKLSVALERQPDKTYYGDDLNLEGKLLLSSDRLNFSLALRLYGGARFFSLVGGVPTMKAKWSTIFPAGGFYTFESPFINPSGVDTRFFSVIVKVGLAKDLGILDRDIVFSGGSVQTRAEADTTMMIDVSGGCGEHSSPDEPWKGCKSDNDQNDSSRGNQEVFTDTFASPLSCRFHLYVKPKTYSTPAHVTVQLSNGKFSFGATNIQVPTVAWDSDGCALQQAVINAVLKIFKTLGIPAGSVQDGINSFIDQKFRDLLAKFADRLEIH